MEIITVRQSFVVGVCLYSHKVNHKGITVVCVIWTSEREFEHEEIKGLTFNINPDVTNSYSCFTPHIVSSYSS